MAKAERRERSTALYETILKLRDLEECRRFFAVSYTHLTLPTIA